MLDVNIEKILPVTEVRDSLNKIIDEVESSDELYVVTKNGKPSAIVVGVHHLEKLTGIDHKELMPTIDLEGEKTDKSLDEPANSLITPESTAEPALAQTPISPITPVSGSPDNIDATNLPSSTTISAMDETSTPTVSGATNGAQASPLTTSSQPIAETTVAAVSSNGLSTPPAINSDLRQNSGRYEQESNSGVVESQENDDSVDDIFGPVDEPDAPVAPASTVSPSLPSTPTSYPAPAQPPVSTSSTIAGPLPAASPAPISTPPAQNPPAMPGSI